MNNINSQIKNILQDLDYQFNQDDSSVYFVSDLNSCNTLHPKIAIDLDKARNFEVTAVYFRFFDGERMPQPKIYIYDNLSELHNKRYYAEIHRNCENVVQVDQINNFKLEIGGHTVLTVPFCNCQKHIPDLRHLYCTTPIRT